MFDVMNTAISRAYIEAPGLSYRRCHVLESGAHDWSIKVIWDYAELPIMGKPFNATFYYSDSKLNVRVILIGGERNGTVTLSGDSPLREPVTPAWQVEELGRTN